MPDLKIADNHSLHYLLIPGQKDMPYLVYLHEGLGCTAMWGDFPALLCKTTGCPGLVYDRLGYGKSSPLNSSRTVHYLHDYALCELPALLAGVIPDRSFILIGHSDGGSISLIFGAERPSLLKGIIIEAAHVFIEPESIAGIKVAKNAWDEGKLQGLVKYHGEKTENLFLAWSETWLANWFRDWSLLYLLPSIEVPLLIIQGSNDQYASIEQVNSIASNSSGYVHSEIVENCAHIPHIEAQSVVLTLMSDFITRVKADTKNKKSSW